MRGQGAAPLVFLALLTTDVAAQSQNKATEQAQRRAATGNLVGHGGPVKAIANHPWFPGRVLTGGFDYAAMLWDVSGEQPKVLHRLSDHNGAVNATALIGRRGLTAGDDGRVTFWDLETGKVMHRFEGHQGKVVSLETTIEGKIAVSAGWDRTARIWNLSTRQAGAVLSDHNGPVNAAVFSRNADTVYTASADGQIRAFNRHNGAFLRRVHAAGQGVNVLLRIESGDKRDQLLFGTVSGQSGIVDGASGEIVHMLPQVERPILAVAQSTTKDWQPTERFAVGSGDGKVRIFSANTKELELEYRTPFGPVWALAFKTIPQGSPSALYYGGLDDFVTYWPFAPRAPFEAVDSSQYPRRFQQSAAASDDPLAKGEIQFARKCSICHTLTPDSANRAGPTLHNVFGRRIATLPGYNYSPELKTLDIVWNAETIAKLFELGPDKFTPGSKMPLQVMSDKSERDALIAFLAEATK